jgi:hypothetical protein
MSLPVVALLLWLCCALAFCVGFYVGRRLPPPRV